MNRKWNLRVSSVITGTVVGILAWALPALMWGGGR